MKIMSGFFVKKSSANAKKILTLISVNAINKPNSEGKQLLTGETTMKFNMKSIMKRANEIARKASKKFGYPVIEFIDASMKMAWAEAKGKNMNIEQITEIINNEDGVKANVWKKYGKERIYIKAKRQYRWVDGGFLTIDGKNLIHTGGKAGWNALPAILENDKYGFEYVR